MVNRSARRRYILGGIFFLLMSIGVAAAYFLTQQSQDIRQQASGNCSVGDPYCSCDINDSNCVVVDEDGARIAVDQGGDLNNKGVLSTSYTGARANSEGGCDGVWMNSFCYMPGDEIAGGYIVAESGRYDYPYLEKKEIYQDLGFEAQKVATTIGTEEDLGTGCGGDGLAINGTCYAYGSTINGYLVMPTRTDSCDNATGDYCYAHLEKIEANYDDWKQATDTYKANGDFSQLEKLYEKTYGIPFSADGLFDPSAANAELLKAQALISSLTSAEVLKKQAIAENSALDAKGGLSEAEQAIYDFNQKIIADESFDKRYQQLDLLTASTARQTTISKVAIEMYQQLVTAENENQLSQIASDKFSEIFGYDPKEKYGELNGVLKVMGIDLKQLESDRAKYVEALKQEEQLAREEQSVKEEAAQSTSNNTNDDQEEEPEEDTPQQVAITSLVIDEKEIPTTYNPYSSTGVGYAAGGGLTSYYNSYGAPTSINVQKARVEEDLKEVRNRYVDLFVSTAEALGQWNQSDFRQAVLNAPIIGGNRIVNTYNIAMGNNNDLGGVGRASVGVGYYLGVNELIDTSNRLFHQIGMSDEEAEYYRTHMSLQRMGDALAVGGAAVSAGDFTASVRNVALQNIASQSFAKGVETLAFGEQVQAVGQAVVTTATKGTLANQGFKEGTELFASGFKGSTGNVFERAREGLTNVYAQGMPTVSDSLTVLGDIHAMNPNELNVLLYDKGLIDASGNATGRRFVTTGDYFGKNSTLDDIADPGYQALERLIEVRDQANSMETNFIQDLLRVDGDRATLLAGNWEPRYATAVAGSIRGEDELVAGIMGKRLSGAEIDAGLVDVSGTADMLGELDYVTTAQSYRGGPEVLLQHNDTANLSLLALSEDNLADLAVLNPDLSDQVQGILDTKFFTMTEITPEEVMTIQKAVSELNLPATEVAGNINQQASSITANALRDPESLDNIVELDWLQKMMSGELQFYQNEEIWGDALVAYADIFSTDTIAHGHSPIEFMRSPRFFAPTNTTPGLIVDETYAGLAQRSGVNLINVDSSLSHNMRLDYMKHINGVPVVDGSLNLPEGAVPNPLAAETVHSGMGIASSMVDDAPLDSDTWYLMNLYASESFGSVFE